MTLLYAGTYAPTPSTTRFLLFIWTRLIFYKLYFQTLYDDNIDNNFYNDNDNNLDFNNDDNRIDDNNIWTYNNNIND